MIRCIVIELDGVLRDVVPPINTHKQAEEVHRTCAQIYGVHCSCSLRCIMSRDSLARAKLAVLVCFAEYFSSYLTLTGSSSSSSLLLPVTTDCHFVLVIFITFCACEPIFSHENSASIFYLVLIALILFQFILFREK